MAESARVAGATHDHRLQALRVSGADRFDPVRFHFIEALARRVPAHCGAVRRVLESKLDAALAAYGERFEQAQSAAGDLVELSRFVAEVGKVDRHSGLAELTRDLAQRSREDGDCGVGEELGAPSELKALRYFRETWSTLSADRQLTQAIAQGPQNAGPLNSHRLVLRSLALMREISPDYLKRFMSYADTLLRLDQVAPRPATRKPLSSAKKGARA